eukprot:GSMAST32.ASY1.ANO1.805.1 assembled CDS
MQHCTDRSLPEIMMMCVPEAWENQTEATMELSKRKFYEWNHVGATLDRNGLRPCRYYITTDDHLIMSSEVGHIEPGKMLLVDLKYGEFVPDEEIKRTVTSQFPYPEWCTKSITVDDVVANKPPLSVPIPVSHPRLSAFGYTQEHLDLILPPMCMTGKEGLGSMGNDAPLACLSKSPKLLFEYFKQHFAQVTNPPIDPFREASVMTLRTPIGPHGNLLTESQDHCRRLVLDLPLLTNNELEAIKRRNLDSRDLTRSRPNKANPDSNEGWRGRSACVGLEHELRHLLMKVDEEIDAGAAYIVLSDRLVDYDNVPIPSLLAVGAVHQHLVRQRRRLDVGLIVDTAEPREVHHFAALLGFGADAICPYLALDTIHKLVSEATDNYFKAVGMGLRKIMAKMGISTLQGYKGAQIFEAVGLGNDVMSMCFTGTPSRIGGQSFEDIGLASLVRHDYVEAPVRQNFGEYHFREGGESHVNTPSAIAYLQSNFSRMQRDAIQSCTIRGALDIVGTVESGIPIESVEPAENIVKRFATGAMSYGSISEEAHETLAIAMNRLGGKSNTGEGGEDPDRYLTIDSSGDSRRSAIKQVASGRFGVTIDYLSNADEIQIKMAQGAKPGEGGELPGHKVSESIAKTRHSTPGDLSQLILDLKSANPSARISVKLVSECGVGTIAAGVAKAHSEHILVSGHDGGTGLAETHQTLLRTGRDVCHLNSCPVGIATQNPELRAKFEGFKSIDEMIGRTDVLRPSERARLLMPATSIAQEHNLDHLRSTPLQTFERSIQIHNTDRSFGSIGQSFGAFGAKGLQLQLEGDANDYVAKGLSGAEISIFPSSEHPAEFNETESTIVGNACLYGATAGNAYFCEYMTGGNLIVLGQTGKNFAAGMSGGLAFVYDPSGTFAIASCNTETVDVVPLENEDKAQHLLLNWDIECRHFVKVYPEDYRRVVESLQANQTATLNNIQNRSFSTSTQNFPFMTVPRSEQLYRDPRERISDWSEIKADTNNRSEEVQTQATQWNSFVSHGQYLDAYNKLILTNNFPEFTGSVCINSDPVSIKNIEMDIIDYAFEHDFVKPAVPGPCGLAAADQLNSAGHQVTVYERSDEIGGLLMYGIPNMKLEKEVVHRRVKILKEAVNVDIEEVTSSYDAVLIAVGSTIPRTLGNMKGSKLKGVVSAMDYLTPATKKLLGNANESAHDEYLNAEGKNVVVIGGGDTGVDCIATALRVGNPWPMWPRIYRTDYAHEESIAKFNEDPRKYNIITKSILDNGMNNVEWIPAPIVDGERAKSTTPKVFDADLVLLAMGFTGKIFKTDTHNVWVAGDCRRGQSLAVWAIEEGRQAAREIDIALLGSTALTVSGGVKRLTYTASLNSSKLVDETDPAESSQRDRLLKGIGW